MTEILIGRLIAHETRFDPKLHFVGSLCRRAHDFANTGMSARYRSMQGCVACIVEQAAERRASATRARASRKVVPPEGTKRCADCEELLTVSQFFRQSRQADGLCSYCKVCMTARRDVSRAKHRAKSIAAMKSRYRVNWVDNLWRGSKASAKARGIPHSITRQDIADLWKRQDGRCFWLGVLLGDAALPSRHPLKPSLDQLHPGEGYHRDNIVLTCTFANLGRSNTPAKEFSEFLQTMSEVFV